MGISAEPFNPEDAFDPARQQDPWRGFAQLRRDAPVYQHAGTGFYIISRYDDCLQAMSDTDTFSSRAYQMLQGPRMSARLPAYFHRRLAEKKSDVDVLAVLETSFLFGLDGEEHRRLRSLIATAFIPARLKKLEVMANEIIVELTRPLREGENEIEVVRRIANPFPCRVIAAILGLGEERVDDFTRWSTCIARNPMLGHAEPAEAALDEYCDTVVELVEFLSAKVAKARAQPGEDVLSALITARDDQGGLSEQEIIAFAQALLVGGQETTTALIASGTKLMLDDPELLTRLRSQPELVDPFVDEVLRHQTPAAAFRTANKDTILGGTSIPAGSPLLLLLKSANRDESKFAHADQVVPDRHPNAHLGFGKGVHFCAGFRLARYEARSMLAALLPLLGDYETRHAHWEEDFSSRKLDRLTIGRRHAM